MISTHSSPKERGTLQLVQYCIHLAESKSSALNISHMTHIHYLCVQVLSYLRNVLYGYYMYHIMHLQGDDCGYIPYIDMYGRPCIIKIASLLVMVNKSYFPFFVHVHVVQLKL